MLKAHYLITSRTCLYCDSEDAIICRATVKDGELHGLAMMCEDCGAKERDVAIEDGAYTAGPGPMLSPKNTDWFNMHNKGVKN